MMSLALLQRLGAVPPVWAVLAVLGIVRIVPVD